MPVIHIDKDDLILGQIELDEPQTRFPGISRGDRIGTNGLFRLNFFNGRFLTGQALRREQDYWDTRARLVAQIHDGGIAWGLTLRYPQQAPGFRRIPRTPDPKYPDEGSTVPGFGHGGPTHFANMADIPVGFGTEEPLYLSPGLAFDDIGRPIVVGKRTKFTLGELIRGAREKPRMVVPSGTAFAPCVCLENVPPGTLDAGPSLPAGPYLLVIEPGECPEGDARVHGKVCSEGKQGFCESDGFRGTFDLSLVRFPVQAPLDDIETAWDLRGVLSGYTFDVFEQKLVRRWDPPFAADERFCKGPGPFTRQPGAVALAMVYIGPDGSVLFVDPWIPRRPIAATASASWAAALRGAPTASVSMARLHQFQCQLGDALAAKQAADPDDDYAYNLYEMGFRRIPPCGFLPIGKPIGPLEGMREHTWNVVTSEWDAVKRAYAQAQSYFDGTSVLTFCTVAPLDDDILEDVVRSMDKDSIPLYPWVRRPVEGGVRWPWGLHGDYGKGTGLKMDCYSVSIALGVLVVRSLMSLGGLTMENLVNREISVVRIVVPIEGLRRRYPVIGRVTGDSFAQLFAAWEAVNDITDTADTYRGWAERLFGDFFGWAAQPRQFAFYVRQRLVMLDILYFAIDLLLDLVLLVLVGQEIMGTGMFATTAPSVLMMPATFNSFTPLYLRNPDVPTLDTGTLRAAANRERLNAAVLVRDGLAQPALRGTVREVGGLAFSELRMPSFWEAYEARRSEEYETLIAANRPEAEAEAVAKDRAIDALMEAYRGAALLKAAAVLAPDSVDALVDDFKANVVDARDSGGDPITTNMDMEAFNHDALLAQPNRRAGELFALARRTFAATPIHEIASDVPISDRVAAVLAGTKADTETLVGTTHAVKINRLVRDRGRRIKEITFALGERGALESDAFRSAFDAEIEKKDGDVGAALGSLKRSGKGKVKETASDLLELRTALTDGGFERFWADAYRKGA